MPRRPTTSASGRPSTSGSAFSDPHSLFWQPGQAGYQHNEHALFEDEDEDEDSEDEDVFAYLPPGSAGHQAQPQSSHSHLAPPPTATANSLSPPPSRFGTGKHSLQSIPEDEPQPPGTTSSDLHVGQAVGGEAYRMSRMGLSTSSTDTSSREVHVSLPSRGSGAPDSKRASSDMGSSVLDVPDFDNLKCVPTLSSVML